MNPQAIFAVESVGASFSSRLIAVWWWDRPCPGLPCRCVDAVAHAPRVADGGSHDARMCTRVKGARMKAVVVGRFGGPDVLQLKEVPDPPTPPGSVRVAVHAAGLNPVDAGNRADGSWAGLSTPVHPRLRHRRYRRRDRRGGQGSGIGDRVMAMTAFQAGAGGYAEFRNTNYHQPTDTSDTLDYDHLAAIVGATGLTVLGYAGLEVT